MITNEELDHLAAAHRSVLKDEPSVVVEVLGTASSAVVRKTYRNLGLRWLQSFGRRCRAAREFDNLCAVERAGVRCTGPRGWSERRRLGCVDESTLVTAFVPASRTLKQVLAGLPQGRPGSTRRQLVVAMARLVAALHRGGFLWSTPMPRNVLVVGDTARAELAVCDTPAGIDLGRPLHGSRLALIDLFLAAFSPSRRRDFSATERLRWLRAYHDGDRPAARRLWRLLARRSVFRNDASRALAMSWHNYILRPMRSRRRPEPPTAT
ncbi:MAG TPA: lipopolysaccharide kinase InaA family protein [Planctomycetota bacterium]